MDYDELLTEEVLEGLIYDYVIEEEIPLLDVYNEMEHYYGTDRFVYKNNNETLGKLFKYNYMQLVRKIYNSLDTYNPTEMFVWINEQGNLESSNQFEVDVKKAVSFVASKHKERARYVDRLDEYLEEIISIKEMWRCPSCGLEYEEPYFKQTYKAEDMYEQHEYTAWCNHCDTKLTEIEKEVIHG